MAQCSAKAQAQSVRHFRRLKRQNCQIQQILLALEQLGNEQEEGQGKKEWLKHEINALEEGQGKKEAFATSQVRAVPYYFGASSFQLQSINPHHFNLYNN